MNVPETQSRWVQLDHSWFFMVRVLRSGWQLAEWAACGEVQLRQVYAAAPPAYFAIVPDAQQQKVVLDRFSELEEAQQAVLSHFDLHRAELL